MIYDINKSKEFKKEKKVFNSMLITQKRTLHHIVFTGNVRNLAPPLLNTIIIQNGMKKELSVKRSVKSNCEFRFWGKFKMYKLSIYLNTQSVRFKKKMKIKFKQFIEKMVHYMKYNKK